MGRRWGHSARRHRLGGRRHGFARPIGISTRDARQGRGLHVVPCVSDHHVLPRCVQVQERPQLLFARAALQPLLKVLASGLRRGVLDDAVLEHVTHHSNDDDQALRQLSVATAPAPKVEQELVGTRVAHRNHGVLARCHIFRSCAERGEIEGAARAMRARDNVLVRQLEQVVRHLQAPTRLVASKVVDRPRRLAETLIDERHLELNCVPDTGEDIGSLKVRPTRGRQVTALRLPLSAAFLERRLSAFKQQLRRKAAGTSARRGCVVGTLQCHGALRVRALPLFVALLDQRVPRLARRVAARRVRVDADAQVAATFARSISQGVLVLELIDRRLPLFEQAAQLTVLGAQRARRA
mmetsp:Transcript_66975/g.161763  ORF Transcript_66975/g.161763 Transcript_66975/m.161763 type:complete len:353 (-) Transcript_66975:991-2049(-)